jgi:hypothetical protein
MYRSAALGFVLFILSSLTSLAGNDCPPFAVKPPVSSVPIFGSELTTFDSNSFRGLSLGLSRAEALNAVLRLGFAIAPTWSASEVHIDFCRGDHVVGSLRFDENNHLVSLDLRSAFFEINQVVLREFADQVFTHYRVHPLVVDDDVCYGDLTCFRGTASNGENFVIVRIGGETRLLVSR